MVIYSSKREIVSNTESACSRRGREMKVSTRYIPPGFVSHNHPLGIGIAYMGTLGNRIGVIAYHGRANKPDFYFTYRDEIAAEKKIIEWFDTLAKWEDMKLARRLAQTGFHTLKVGDILHYSWGYDQTNCEFYQIVSITAHTVDIREIASEVVPGSDYPHGMACTLIARPNVFLKKPIERHRANKTNCVSMKFGSASPWDGKPCYLSWYA